ncbi:MAG TPA: hypothetical protein VFB76_02215 [Candidatus Angelobacter sp.]|nr:hypothetical protein [Candidatus Angelobacter sp.]
MQKVEWPLALLSTTLAAAFLFQGNLHTDDTGIIAGLILLFAGILAFLFRKAGLILGALLGLSIVASELWNWKMGTPRAHMSKFSDFVLLFVVVSALSVAGSLAGFAMRRALRTRRTL